MKLYYYQGACSLVVRIVMNELDLKFEDEYVDLKTKKTSSGGDFLLINPKGSVPVLGLDDGDLLTENQVILQYLVDKTPGQKLLAPVGDMRRYHTLEWLNFMSTELHKTFGFLFHPLVSEEMKTEVLIPLIMKKFAFVDKRLSTKPYLMGDQLTLPDAYLFVMILWAHFFKIDISLYTNLSDFMGRMYKRQAVINSLKQEKIGS